MFTGRQNRRATERAGGGGGRGDCTKIMGREQ